ncbi:MAG: hypothetical protein FDZ70_10665, partial [Actinobacteria bacterium]
MDIMAYRLPILGAAALLFLLSLIYLTSTLRRRRWEDLQHPLVGAATSESWVPEAVPPDSVSVELTEAARPGPMATILAEPLRTGDWQPVTAGPEHALFDHPETVLPAGPVGAAGSTGDLAELAASLESTGPLGTAPGPAPAQAAADLGAWAPPQPAPAAMTRAADVVSPAQPVEPPAWSPAAVVTPAGRPVAYVVAGVDDLAEQLALLGIGSQTSPAGAAFAPIEAFAPVPVAPPAPVPVVL